jgi:CO/xanthine dehydrogenase FAD-binding subunit
MSETKEKSYKQVFLPHSIAELFSDWEQCPDAALIAGGTALAGGSSGAELPLRGNIISLEALAELHSITRTERYIEIGAAANLNEAARLGKVLPKVLFLALKNIGNTALRNLITFGGCIYTKESSLLAALAVLDTRYELVSVVRNRGSASPQGRWVSASHFSPEKQDGGAPTLLSRIRIPFKNWTDGAFKALKPGRGFDTGISAAIAFTASSEKDNLNGSRTVYANAALPGLFLRQPEADAFLTGRHVPLDKRESEHFASLWNELLQGETTVSAFERARILYFLEKAVTGIKHNFFK